MNGRRLAIAILTIPCVSLAAAQETAVQTTAAPERLESLSLNRALTLADSFNPRLPEAQHAIGMAEGDVITAGLWPNPKFSVAVEGYTPGGENPPPDLTRLENGVEAANRVLARGGSSVSLFVPGIPDPGEPEQQQWVIGLEQEVPLGPARRHRKQAATLDKMEMVFASSQTRADVYAGVRSAFTDVVFFQTTQTLRSELAQRLAGVRDLVRARFEAGDVAELELIKANAALARFETEAEETSVQLAAAQARLAAAMGIPGAEIESCSGNLDTLAHEFNDKADESLDSDHPQFQAWDSRKAAAEARIAAADAARWPSLELGLGYRYYEATEQDTWDFTVGFALPIFDRNQGERLKARERALRETASVASARHTLERDLLTAARTADGYADAQTQYARNVLVPLEEVLRIAQTAYDAGDTNLLDVLDAHRELAEARLVHTDYQRKYVHALVEMMRLTTAGVESPATSGPSRGSK